MVQLKVFFPQDMQEASSELAPHVNRFDIFKGLKGADGRIQKIRSVGTARLTDGYATYIIQLKTFLSDTFYLLPERPDPRRADFAILTREDSAMQGRRFFWNKIGVGDLLPSPNHGLLNLSWDILGADDIYMNMTPMPPPESASNPLPDAVAA
ncbi:MAG: hypothetical protein NTV34_17825 [Proteobacteria bacterium]|nr:hypothetical protein [Pseudomonadota bacterium]